MCEDIESRAAPLLLDSTVEDHTSHTVYFYRFFSSALSTPKLPEAMNKNTSDILFGMGGWIENTSDERRKNSRAKTNKSSRDETGRSRTEKRTNRDLPITPRANAAAADQKAKRQPRRTQKLENYGSSPSGLMREVQLWHPQFRHLALGRGSPRPQGVSYTPLASADD